MWQRLAQHGVQHFQTTDDVRLRISEVENALSQLCDAISVAAGECGKSGIERARSLRSKPADGGKSLYECLNQLTHYWYCCAAGLHLLKSGYTHIQTRPTAEESTSAEGTAFDIIATHRGGASVVAEVFCVSSALWPTKVSKTTTKLLRDAPPTSYRLIYYNREAKPTYQAKRVGLFFLAIDAPTRTVASICATDPRTLPGIRSDSKIRLD